MASAAEAPATSPARQASLSSSPGPQSLLAAVDTIIKPREVVQWLAGLANGIPQQQTQQLPAQSSPATGAAASATVAADPSMASTPSSPLSLPTGGIQIEDDVDAFAASRLARTVEADATPDVGLTPQTTSVLTSTKPVEGCGSHTLPPAPQTLDHCTECQEPISGAAFMLLDHAYCCQRHRLVAYHKSERNGKEVIHQPIPAITTGLYATHGTWM